MAKYFVRDAVIDLITRRYENPEICTQEINSIPAADVAPLVHGRWSDAGFGELPKHAPYGWACSVCGGISFNNEYIYCPNCGAKMDGGADHAAD